MFTAARGVCSKAELKSITEEFTRPPCPTCGGVTERNGSLVGLHVERLRRRRTAESGCQAADPTVI